MPKPNWTAIVNALTPIFGQLASRGDNGGFMQGYQQSQQRLDASRRQSEQETQAKQKVGADYRLNMLDRLLKIDDPMAFETMKGAAGDAGAQAYGLEPDAFRDVQFSDEKRLGQLTKELSEQLERMEKGGYDLFELSDSGAAITLKNGTHVPIASAIEMTRRAPVAGGQAIRPPKKQPTATGTAAERAAAIRQQIEEAMESGDGAMADRLQNRYRNLLETEREFGEASRKPSDPELGDMNKTLKELQIEASKARLNPDPELAGMNKTLKQLQIDAARDRADKPAPDLPPIVQRRVNQQEDAFKNEPAVKRTNTIAEGYAFVNSLSTTSESPSDDQALIYAFAKAMDPESVVREGEYATVQKYAQSWLENFKFSATRVLSNSEFLSAQARKNMKATIRTKFAASKQAYDNARRQYAVQINRLTGLADGESRLLDYAAGYTPTSGTSTQPTGPLVGERRMINGQMGEWDGKGWKAVQ